MLFGVPIWPMLDVKIPIQMESDLDTGRSPSPHKKGLRKKDALALRVFSSSVLLDANTPTQMICKNSFGSSKSSTVDGQFVGSWIAGFPRSQNQTFRAGKKEATARAREEGRT